MMNKTYIETIKIVDNKADNLEYHQARYENVLNHLGIEEIKKLDEHIQPPDWGFYRCKITYGKDIFEIEYFPYKKREISKLKIIFDNEIEYDKKASNREKLNQLFEQRDEADDVLIIKNLLVTDTTIANIAFYKDGIWVTPKSPLLKGTTRARLLDEGKIVEANIKVQELRGFSQVALLNAMIDFDILEKCEFLI